MQLQTEEDDKQQFKLQLQKMPLVDIKGGMTVQKLQPIEILPNRSSVTPRTNNVYYEEVAASDNKTTQTECEPSFAQYQKVSSKNKKDLSESSKSSTESEDIESELGNRRSSSLQNLCNICSDISVNLYPTTRTTKQDEQRKQVLTTQTNNLENNNTITNNEIKDVVKSGKLGRS